MTVPSVPHQSDSTAPRVRIASQRVARLRSRSTGRPTMPSTAAGEDGKWPSPFPSGRPRAHWLLQGLIAAGLSTAAYAANAQSAPASAASDATPTVRAATKTRKQSDTDATPKENGALSAISVSAPGAGNAANGFVARTVQTGQYRGLDALDVPATVSTVTRGVLEAQAATGLYDALRNAPGVVRQQVSGIGYDQLTVRGITLDNRGSYFLDGVLPIDNNIWMPMEDKERVEVLKGASALYYGFTVPAGIVNMVMKRAGDTPVTSVGTLLDSHGSVGVKADISRRFGTDNQFGLRVNAMDEHVESAIDGDRGYRRFASVAADWRVNSRLTLKYDLEHIDQRIVEQAGITPLAAVNGVITLPKLPSASTLLVPNDKKTNATSTAQLLRADYNLSDNWSANFTVGQSITQRDRWLWILQKYNVNTGTGSLQGSKQNGQFYENKDVRAEVNGVFNTGPIGHDVTIGVQENWLFQPNFTTYYYTATQNLYSPINITSLTAAGSKAFYAQHIRTRGIYLFDRIALTQKWDLTVGARYSDYHQTQAGTVTEDVHRTSPSASLVYKVTPSTSIYGSYVEGLESPGSAPATATNAYQVLPAAVSRQEELGVRHRLSNQAMVSMAVFNLRQPTASTDSTGYYGLSGMGRYRGLEFAFQGDVTKRLSVVLSAMYLNARLMNGSDPTTDGKRPEDTPRYTASAFLNYKIPHVPGLSLNGGAYYVGARPINDENQAFIGGYTLFSAGARYETMLFHKHASFQLNIDNALNKHYWASAGSSQLGIGLDRTISLTSTIDF